MAGKKVQALVLKAPGTNCDQETVWALSQAGAKVELKYFAELEQRPKTLDGYDLLFLPGGFSYGDYLGSGKIWSLFLESALGESLRRFVDQGRIVMGACNGFQVLVKMGLLPGPGATPASLTINSSRRFECRWITLRLEQNSILFQNFKSPILDFQFELPVAHGEGRFVLASHEVLKDLEAKGQVFLRYEGGNPNGSMGAVAGITNHKGNVIGLMPHPERWVIRQQHYDWRRRPDLVPWGLEFLKATLKLAN